MSTYTRNHGSIHEKKHLGFSISGSKFDPIPNVENVWFIGELSWHRMSSGGPADYTSEFGLVDNYGRLWKASNGLPSSPSLSLHFKKMSDGLGCPMPDEVIDRLQAMKRIHGYSPIHVDDVYANILLCAQYAMECARLKKEISEMNCTNPNNLLL
jgi:hypothetical protein